MTSVKGVFLVVEKRCVFKTETLAAYLYNNSLFVIQSNRLKTNLPYALEVLE